MTLRYAACRQLKTALVLMTLGAGMAGCTTIPELEPVEYDERLLDGELLFGETIEPAPEEDLIGITPEMRAFVQHHVDPTTVSFGRFRQLMTGMVRNGFFIDQYDRAATYDAATTFATRKGNCLSYTNLFVALAREAGLDADFQLVHGAPTWNVLGGYLVRNNHVNVVLGGMNLPGQPRSEITVDFNDIKQEEERRRGRISDEHGASLHYANLAVDQLQRGNNRDAFAYLKRAVLTYPHNADLWINLGALYATADLNAEAEQAQRVALTIDPRNKTAIAGLANSLSAQGKTEEAATYLALAMRYQRRNPYYHFALAQRAYANENYEEALASVDEAIKLKRNASMFYGLRATLAEQIGDERLLAQSVRMQEKHAKRLADRRANWRSRLD